MSVSYKYKGTLHIKIGPMFSGKTTWLNSELTKFADRKFKVLKIIHSDDIRQGSESGSTHNSSFTKLPNNIDLIRTNNLETVDVSMYHVIGIDEAQFFVNLRDTVEHWIENMGKHIRIAGLDGDFKRQKFGQILDLIPICDKISKINASCNICTRQLLESDFNGDILSITGPFTKKLTADSNQIDIGGDDKYIPVCRYHFHHLETFSP